MAWGDTDRDYHKPFAAKQSKYLGEAAWGRDAFKQLYYQDILQANENAIFEKMKPVTN
jgi:hypothetical protein